MSDEILKVRDLPEDKRTELLARMKEAELKGVYLDYKVITAEKKINEYKNRNSNDVSNEETSNKTLADEVQTEKVQEEIKETKICHICRTPVIGKVCPNCGFYI